MLCNILGRPLLVSLSFSFVCVKIYDFSLPLWYAQTFLMFYTLGTGEGFHVSNQQRYSVRHRVEDSGSPLVTSLSGYNTVKCLESATQSQVVDAVESPIPSFLYIIDIILVLNILY